jgi:hypothetical protein
MAYGRRLSVDRIRTLDEARRGAVNVSRASPRAGGGRSSIEVCGPKRQASPENHYRGPNLSSSSICVPDAISNVMVLFSCMRLLAHRACELAEFRRSQSVVAVSDADQGAR